MWEIIPPRIQYKYRVSIEKYKTNIRIHISLNIRKKLDQLDCKYCNIYKNNTQLMVQFLKDKGENAKKIGNDGKISLPKYVIKDFWNDENGIKTVDWYIDKGNLIIDLNSLKR